MAAQAIQQTATGVYREESVVPDRFHEMVRHLKRITSHKSVLGSFKKKL